MTNIQEQITQESTARNLLVVGGDKGGIETTIKAFLKHLTPSLPEPTKQVIVLDCVEENISLGDALGKEKISLGEVSYFTGDAHSIKLLINKEFSIRNALQKDSNEQPLPSKFLVILNIKMLLENSSASRELFKVVSQGRALGMYLVATTDDLQSIPDDLRANFQTVADLTLLTTGE